MNNKELKEVLDQIPDDAIVFVESDHGQTPETAQWVNVTDEEMPTSVFSGEDFSWNNINSIPFKDITAILIR